MPLFSSLPPPPIANGGTGNEDGVRGGTWSYGVKAPSHTDLGGINMFTQRHYEAVAEAVAKTIDNLGLGYVESFVVIDQFIELFQSDNAAFKPDLFRKRVVSLCTVQVAKPAPRPRARTKI